MPPSLADLPLIKGAAPEAVAEAERAVRWLTLPGGRSLFDDGDAANELYFLISGALVAHRPLPDGGDELVGYIRPGEPVGEMALVTGDRHSASVSALRDSELLVLDRADFLRLTRSHPDFLSSLSRLMLVRARETRRGNPRAEPRVFALFSASPSIDLSAHAREIARMLEAMGKRVSLVGDEAENRSASWFDDLERGRDVVLLAARMGDTDWFRTCLRQADRMWLFVRKDARPSRPMPLTPTEDSPARRFRLVDIVMLEQGGSEAATPQDWIDAAGAHRFFRWRGPNDTARLARVIAGLSVGLVLSGGGARAYAHVGAVRALREWGLPIDFVGGASMGAIVAGAVAMGWNDDEIEERVRDAFVTSNPLGDFVLPVVALTAGNRVRARLAKHFGDARIEELAIPYFAVSSNLTSGVVHVHREGYLREALRASIALPGILPPVVAAGEVLVDGAVLNNFPVDVMQNGHRGLVVGVDVARQRTLDAHDFEQPPGFFEWAFKYGLHEPPPIASLLIRTATVHMNPAAQRQPVDCMVLPELQDVEIRAWKRFDQAVAAGYAGAVTALQDASPRLLAARAAARVIGG